MKFQTAVSHILACLRKWFFPCWLQ